MAASARRIQGGVVRLGPRQSPDLRTASNGDIFLAETSAGRIRVFSRANRRRQARAVCHLCQRPETPYGLAFYPLGPDPQWLYVGNAAEVVRFSYHKGELKAGGPPQHVADLPTSWFGHSTRPVEFSRDGKRMFVAVGSGSNADDPDTHPAEKNRADILCAILRNCVLSVYAYGIRNPGGGIAVNPQTGELWCSVNERDGLGDKPRPRLHHASAGRGASTAGRGGTWADIRIPGIRASIRS